LSEAATAATEDIQSQCDYQHQRKPLPHHCWPVTSSRDVTLTSSYLHHQDTFNLHRDAAEGLTKEIIRCWWHIRPKFVVQST